MSNDHDKALSDLKKIQAATLKMAEDLAAQAVNLAAKAEALAAKADDLGWMGSRMIDLRASLQSSHEERVLVDKETGRKCLVANACYRLRKTARFW